MKTVKYCILPQRQWVLASGEDAKSFLHSLITQDIYKLAPHVILYGLLLTPQGRFLNDLFFQEDEHGIWIDCEDAPALIKRLNLYKLRARVDLSLAPHQTIVFFDGQPEMPEALPDPRQENLGYRLKTQPGIDFPWAQEVPLSHWHEYRIQRAIPEGRLDMIPEKSIPLECLMDQMNAIDWKKGCYLGQELTARTHYQGLIRKRLMPITFDGPTLNFGSAITQGEREMGEIRSCAGQYALALLRLEALQDTTPLMCENQIVRVLRLTE